MIEAQTTFAPSFLASSLDRLPRFLAPRRCLGGAEMAERMIFLPQKWCKVNLTRFESTKHLQNRRQISSIL